MTEPTQEEIQANAWMAERMLICPAPKHLVEYANHVTGTLQAKIDRLEIGMVELERIAANLRNVQDMSILVIDERDKRTATLEAELAARDFVPIGDEHNVSGHGKVLKDGWSEDGFYQVRLTSKLPAMEGE